MNNGYKADFLHLWLKGSRLNLIYEAPWPIIRPLFFAWAILAAVDWPVFMTIDRRIVTQGLMMGCF